MLFNEWPKNWEDWRIPDETIGAAYENSSPQQRARVKATLSLVESVYGIKNANLIERQVQRKSYGFGYIQRSVPAPWVLFVINVQECTPVELAAAVMPAHLAGVSNVAALCVNACVKEETPDNLSKILKKNPLPKVNSFPEAKPEEAHSEKDFLLKANFLNALEIAGIEDYFALPSDISLEKALDDFRKALDDCKKSLDGLKKNSSDDLKDFSNGRILFLGFDYLPINEEQKNCLQIWHDRNQQGGSSVILSPDLQDLCFYPDLPPHFFRNVEMKIFSLK